MSHAHAESAADLTYLDSFHDFGLPMHTYAGPYGTRIRLSQAGLQQLDNPDFRTVLDTSLQMIGATGQVYHDESQGIQRDDPRSGERRNLPLMHSHIDHQNVIIKAGGRRTYHDYGIRTRHAVERPSI